MSTGTLAASSYPSPSGVSLGTLGGGAILMARSSVLLYVAAIQAQPAIRLSLIVVGATTMIGAVAHYWRGNINVNAALLFGVSGIAGSFLGSYLTDLFSDRLLLGVFAALMVIVGFAMLRQRIEPEDGTRCSVGLCLLSGPIVAGLTGFLGVGGRFLIVPALIVFAALPEQNAAGTSLAIISAAAGVFGQLRKTSIEVLAAKFAGPAILGMFGGFAAAGKVPNRQLQRAYGLFIIILGLVFGTLTATGTSLPGGR